MEIISFITRRDRGAEASPSTACLDTPVRLNLKLTQNPSRSLTTQGHCRTTASPLPKTNSCRRDRFDTARPDHNGNMAWQFTPSSTTKTWSRPKSLTEYTCDYKWAHSPAEDSFDSSSTISPRGRDTPVMSLTLAGRLTQRGDDPLTPGGSPSPGLFRSVACPVCCAGRRRRRRRRSSRDRSRSPTRC